MYLRIAKWDDNSRVTHDSGRRSRINFEVCYENVTLQIFTGTSTTDTHTGARTGRVIYKRNDSAARYRDDKRAIARLIVRRSMSPLDIPEALGFYRNTPPTGVDVSVTGAYLRHRIRSFCGKLQRRTHASATLRCMRRERRQRRCSKEIVIHSEQYH